MSGRDYSMIDVRLEVEASESRNSSVAQDLMREAAKEIREQREEIERLMAALMWA